MCPSECSPRVDKLLLLLNIIRDYSGVTGMLNGKWNMQLPNKQLLSAMRDAYNPYTNFGTCREARWSPTVGQIPHGFIGANHRPARPSWERVIAEIKARGSC